jgi:predicted Zn finger-like uncharacterized protein
VFRLSAEVLRAAGGQVRCGRCGEVFNALARLAEDPAAFPAGESLIDLETRANEILESAVPPLRRPANPASETDDIIDIEDFDSHEVDFARLQVVEKFVEDPEAEAPSPRSAPPPRTTAAPPSSPPPSSPPVSSRPAAAKPTVSAPAPARPSASKPNPQPASAPAPAPAPTPTAAQVPTPAPETEKPAAAAPAVIPPRAPAPPPTSTQADEDMIGDGSMEFTLPPGELDRVFIESPTSNRPFPGGKADPTQDAGAGEASHEPGSPAIGGGFEVSEDVRREMLSGIAEPAALPEISQAPHRSIPFNVWMAAAMLLALLLCLQWIHANREWLATHAPLRGSLRGVYAAMGVSAAAPADLSAYQLRQWGVTGDPGANGTLRVRASILNTAAQLQPYPLLRVTLANRFGAKIGTRDFEPAEYMGKPVARMLAPGERADATLDIVDPGKDAEGFEIDVCMRGVEQRIACAGDVAPQAKQPRGGS